MYEANAYDLNPAITGTAYGGQLTGSTDVALPYFGPLSIDLNNEFTLVGQNTSKRPC